MRENHKVFANCKCCTNETLTAICKFLKCGPQGGIEKEVASERQESYNQQKFRTEAKQKAQKKGRNS